MHWKIIIGGAWMLVTFILMIVIIFKDKDKNKED